MHQLTLLSVALLAWSLVANLVIGEVAYTSRNLALTLLLLAGWLWWTTEERGAGLEQVGLSARSVGSGLRWGVLAAAVIAGAISVGVLLADVVEPIAILLADERATQFADDLAFVALVRIPLGTAVFEEVAFRGVLLALAMQVLSPVRAVIWSAVVFGLWHVAPTISALRINEVAISTMEGVATIVGAVVVTTIAGVAFSWLRLASGSLLAPILAHCATNSLSLVAAVVVQRGSLNG